MLFFFFFLSPPSHFPIVMMSAVSPQDIVRLLRCNVSLMEWDESATDAATAIYLICILLQPFGFDLTFRSGSCGRIHVWSRPKALLKIDERKIRQSESVGSSTHAAYDTLSPLRGCLRAVHHACFSLLAHAHRPRPLGCTEGWALSVGHVLFLTIHPHPSEKKQRKGVGGRDWACPSRLQ